MDRLFLDANVLFSAAYKPDSRLLQIWKLKDVTLYTSRYAIEEARVNLSDEYQWARLEELTKKLQRFDSVVWELRRGVDLPIKDRPILLAAVEAHASHLLTGDVRHFGPYFGKKIEGVLVTSPAEYLRSRMSRK
jgi:uncharacterized protein